MQQIVVADPQPGLAQAGSRPLRRRHYARQKDVGPPDAQRSSGAYTGSAQLDGQPGGARRRSQPSVTKRRLNQGGAGNLAGEPAFERACLRAQTSPPGGRLATRIGGPTGIDIQSSESHEVIVRPAADPITHAQRASKKAKESR